MRLCLDCSQPMTGPECVCQAPWLRKHTVEQAFYSAMFEDADMKAQGRTPIETLRKSLDLSPCEPLPYEAAISRKQYTIESNT